MTRVQAPPVRDRDPFTAVHSSGRFDRSLQLLRAEVLEHRKIASVVTRTEASNRDDARVRILQGPGWEFYRADRDKGDDECTVEWKADRWELFADPFTRQLTRLTYRRSKEYGGGVAAPQHAIVVPLRSKVNPRHRVYVHAAHLALDNTPARARAWHGAMEGWAKLVQELRAKQPAKHLLMADWNKNYRQDDERRAMANHLRPIRLHAAWAGHVPAHGGTHGPRSLLDGAWTNLQVLGCKLLPDTPSSDHRPLRVRLSW